ncbi:hypothetical protein AURDEDRAFT_130151 [Auricularia subglabra TFB-10046 SS5]|uniref:F-box domain-containing protein n=1 Tax=Auricularia subglabra (strain TFB-10046 / SS5) TaxID=717982 RepID=J0D929_AURST|nr:hypothetical protein AURDEDRAFT_130151 [Auricularia subglabra TFB-10046 SS5]
MSARCLPPEILLEVFGHGLGSADLARVCRTCRHFRDVAEPLLNATVALSSTIHIRSFILGLLANPGRGDFVRTLTLDWSRELNAGSPWALVTNFAFWQFPRQSVFDNDDASTVSNPLEIPTAIVQEAEARGMARGLRTAICQRVACAHVVLLLDLLPRLRSLHVTPSAVEFWFWAAFPNPYTPVRLPHGLLSLESLDVHYQLENGPAARPSIMSAALGYGHIKLVSALLLPSLRQLSFSGDDGDMRMWNSSYVDGADGSSHIDMASLQERSSVSQLMLRDAEMPPQLLSQIMSMLATPEHVHIEQDDPEYALFNDLLGRPTLRSFTLVEYPREDGEHEPKPLAALSTRDHLTHLALPVHALALDDEEYLARKLPRGVEHLELAYTTAEHLRNDIDRLVRLARDLGEPGRSVRHLTIRPMLGSEDEDRIRAACEASDILLFVAPWIKSMSFSSRFVRNEAGIEDMWFDDPDYMEEVDLLDRWDVATGEDDVYPPVEVGEGVDEV